MSVDTEPSVYSDPTRFQTARYRAAALLAELDASRASGRTTIVSGPAVSDVYVASASVVDAADLTLARLPEAVATWAARQGRRLLQYSRTGGLVAVVPEGAPDPGVLPAQLQPAAARGNEALDPAADVAAILGGLAQPQQPPTVLLVDWVDLTLPDDPIDPAGRLLLEHLVDVALNPDWREAGHQLVLLDHNGTTDNRLTSAIGVHVHLVGRPVEAERVAAAQILARGARRPMALAPELDPVLFGRLTGGQMLDAMVRARDASSPTAPITIESIVAAKSSEIARQAHGVVRVLSDPRRRFGEAVAGLPQIRLLVEESIRMRSSIRAILVGPPGVGKSYAAVAIANQLGVPCITFGLVRNMYVGESERQLELALDLIRAYAPVVVFWDEADQTALGSRETAVDSSDVTRTMRGRLFEEFGDNSDKHGVSVVLASNVVFGLDDATLSRFEPIPVLYPTTAELADILIIDAQRHGAPIEADSVRAAVLHYADRPLSMSGRDIVRIRQDAGVLAHWDHRHEITGADVACAMEASLHHTTPDAEMQILHSLLAARTMRRLPWEAARWLGEEYAPPAYLQRYLDANGAPDRVRIAHQLETLRAPR